MPATKKTKQSVLSEWVRRFSDGGLPVLSHTSDKLADMAKEDEASASQFAEVILRDPQMTTKVLRVVNSAQYNPAGKAINTISRAVVVLGVEQLRSICYSVAMVDELLKGNPRERLLLEVARSYHAAVQAEKMAKSRNDDEPEEAFVAALLYHVGALGFWCYGDDLADDLDKTLRSTRLSPEEAEEQVLGFKLGELTAEIAKEWRLNEALVAAVNEDEGTHTANILLSHELAEAVGRGWDYTTLKPIIEKCADHLGMDVNQAQSFIEECAAEAVSQMMTFRAGAVANLIPVPGQQFDVLYGADVEELACDLPPQPNPLLQLNISREIFSLGLDKPDVNLLLLMTLEGLHRGVGLDRVAVALMTEDNKHIQAKFVQQFQESELKENFHFPIQDPKTHLFARVIETEDCAWVGSHREKILEKLRSKSVNKRLGDSPFFVGPIVIADRIVGIFYGDRHLSGRTLTADDFEGFQHFIHQSNLCLELISRRGKPGG